MVVQYDICKNPDNASRARVPYLVVLQSDLLSPLETAVVAPVMPERLSNSITKLNPVISINGTTYRVSMQDLAGIPRKRLGAVVANAGQQHLDFVAAVDLLFTGI
jgi:toxin CcdB